jgi:UDP-N-acetylglucosamine 2-epimerase
MAGIPSYDDFIIVIWHPDTLANEDENIRQVTTLIRALDKVSVKSLVIGPNEDRGSVIVYNKLRDWCHRTKNVFRNELPRNVYLTLLKNCECLVGNSSSGYYEAPSFGINVIDIGDRQKGRIKPDCVYQCPIDAECIASAIRIIKGQYGCSVNPYSSGLAGQRIASIIAKIDNPKKLLRKKWHDVGTSTASSSVGTARYTPWGSPAEAPPPPENSSNVTPIRFVRWGL